MTLNDDGKTLWLFFLSCPFGTPIPGVIVAGEMAIAECLGWDVKRYRMGYRELHTKGLSVLSEGRLIWLTKALRYQKVCGPKHIISMSKSWDDVPECDLKLTIWEDLKIACKSWNKLFDKGFAIPHRRGIGYGNVQEQEHEQDQEQELEQEKKEHAPNGAPVLVLVGDSKGKPRKKRSAFEASASERASAMTVLERLGARNGVSYTGSDAHVRLIVNRLRDGVTELELRAVVSYCASPKASGGLGWEGNDTMHAHLCPETLFGPNTHTRYLDPARTWARDELARAKQRESQQEAR